MMFTRIVKEIHRQKQSIVACVSGYPMSGKTSYALWIAYEVYGSWKKALDRLFFSPREGFEEIGEAIETGERIPLIIMDDIDMWIDSVCEREKTTFIKLFRVAKGVVSTFLFTLSGADPPKWIIERRPLRIDVISLGVKEGVNEEVKEAMRRAREWGLSPKVSVASWEINNFHPFVSFSNKRSYDYYPTHYPVFEEYNRMRQEAVKHYYEKLRAWLEDEEPDPREKPLAFIRKQLEKGVSRKEIVKQLVKHGVPRSTAYYYVKKVETAYKQ